MQGLHFDIVLIYFIYGLAFFSMGIALLLESGRSPLLAERRALLPLAVFGLLHGMHEWIEIVLLQGVWLGTPFPAQLSWFRISWLVISFIPLVYFGILMLVGPENKSLLPLVVPAALLLIYLISIWINAKLDPEYMVARADALARYLLAVPGGILAGLGLRKRALQVRQEGRQALARRFQWAAIGFAIYGMTQVFVPASDLFPASLINATQFLNLFGFPIQVLRASMAVLVTINLLRSIQIVERERQDQLFAAQNARLEALQQIQRDLEEREALRRQLLRQTVIAQEDERTRIARELHDETAQFLTALSLNLATLEKMVPRKPEARAMIDQLQALSRQMSQGIYRLVHDLRPAQLDDLGLVAALQYLAEEERQRTGLQVTIRVQGERRRLDPLVETVLFRIAQEALTNVARHAQTDRATLELIFASRQVVLSVTDQGVGFARKRVTSPMHGFGLEGMRERSESVGGIFELISPPKGGTIVRVTIPIESKESMVAQESSYEYHPADVG